MDELDMLKIKPKEEKETLDATKEVVIKKFIIEFKQYPNGDLFFHKQYAVGSSKFVPKRRPKKKLELKKEEIQDEEIY